MKVALPDRVTEISNIFLQEYEKLQLIGICIHCNEWAVISFLCCPNLTPFALPDAVISVGTAFTGRCRSKWDRKCAISHGASFTSSFVIWLVYLG